jgi:hypothetical protein
VFAVFFLAFTGASFLYPKKMQWPAYGVIVRGFMCATVGVMAWSYTTYGYNLYLDQAHIFDRLLLLSCAVGLFFHPGFIAPFCCVMILVMSQFSFPLSGYSMSDKQLPIYAIILFAAVHLATVGKAVLCSVSSWIRGKREKKTHSFLAVTARLLLVFRWLLVGLNGRLFLFVLLCLIGSCYIAPAMHKIEISPSGTEWLFENGLSRIVAGCFFQENHFFFTEGGGGVAGLLAQKYGDLLIFGTLVIELSAILLLVNRKVCAIVLVLLALLHLGICTLSGVFFWKWALIELVLSCLILGREARPVFSRRGFVLSVVLMLSCSLHFRPAKLGWFDTSLLSDYRFVVTTESGREFCLVKNSVAPFELTFVFQRFGFLNPEKVLGGMGQTADYELASMINGAGPSAITEIIETDGEVPFDPEAASRFDDFLVRYFENWNRRLDRRLLPFDAMSPPNHILSGSSANSFQWDEQVIRIDLYYETAYFDGESIRPLDEVLIRTIPIAGDSMVPGFPETPQRAPGS